MRAILDDMTLGERDRGRHQGSRGLETLERRVLLDGSDPAGDAPPPERWFEVVEFEDFDAGGEGVGYHDADAVNRGGLDGYGGVDVGYGHGGIRVVGYVRAGEWLAYTPALPRAGFYQLQVLLTNPAAGASFHIEQGGVDVSGPVPVPQFREWSAFTSITIDKVYLRPGEPLRFAFDAEAANGAVGNFESFVIRSVAEREAFPAGWPSAAPHRAGDRIEAEDFDVGGEGVSYHDNDPFNVNRLYRAGGVDVGYGGNVFPWMVVGYTAPGEWLEYTIETPADGPYSFAMVAANPAAGGAVRVIIDGVEAGGPYAVPETGSWSDFADVTFAPFELSAGVHTMRVLMDRASGNGAVGNFDAFRLVRSSSLFRGTVGAGVRPGIVLPRPDGGTAVVHADALTALNVAGLVTATTPRGAWGTIDAVLQPDGKVLVLTGWGGDVSLRRFNADLTPDASFGVGGVVAVEDGPSFWLAGLALEPAGSILVGGGTSFVRYDASGARDATFALDVDAVTLPAGRSLHDDYDLIGAWVLEGVDAQGRIYASIESDGPPHGYYPDRERYLNVARFHADGALDATYGAGGASELWMYEFDGSSPNFFDGRVLPDGTFAVAIRDRNTHDWGGSNRSGVATIPPGGNDDSRVVWTARDSDYIAGLEFAYAGADRWVVAGSAFHSRWDPHGDSNHEFDVLYGPGLPSPLARLWENLFGQTRIRDVAFDTGGDLLVAADTGLYRFATSPATSSPVLIEAEDFAEGPEGVAYHDADALNRGGVDRGGAGVDAGYGGSGLVVGYTQAGEWLTYRVDVANAGRYALTARAANPAAGGQVRFSFEGGPAGVIDVDRTGWWNDFADARSEAFDLAAGSYLLRIDLATAAANGAVGNFDYFLLAPAPL